MLVALAASGTSAFAERIQNPIAVFNGLDKITGITTRFEVKVNEEGRFGALVIKPQICYTRSITEEPKTTSFVQIEELGAAETRNRVFSGWMFAESPGLNALEHPIIDVWLIGCLDPNAPPPPVEAARKPEGEDEQASSESGDTGEESDQEKADSENAAEAIPEAQPEKPAIPLPKPGEGVQLVPPADQLEPEPEEPAVDN